tara:strand:- start:513 stop:743 length:231 start_codon:yes stop_codon:yes gene_type:complete
MPKFYVESTTSHALIIDRPNAELAARSLILLNPDMVYEYMKSKTDVYICVNENGFGGQLRTDMIFSLEELINKKEH